MLALCYLLAPQIVVSPSSPELKTYTVVEFAVQLNIPFQNPFDPDEIAIDGVFTHNQETRTIPAFWDGQSFRLRFTPTQPGAWSLTVHATTPTTQSQTKKQTLQVGPSHNPGYIRVAKNNPRYLQFDSGQTFLPIGLNLCWPDKSGLESYDKRFAKLKSVGGNFARIWTTQERRLETKEAGLGRYDQNSAAFYDGVFNLATKHGIRTMLTFDDYRVLAKTDYFNAHWDQSPYNAANGGPLKEPTDFFNDALSRKLYKRRLRYLVARYSAYPSLGFWEIYNEQDNIPKPGVPTEWFREMTNYLATIDPYHHPITTSYSWDDKSEVWQSPALSLTQRHLYGQGDTTDFVGMIQQNAKKLDPYGKPRLIGEFGITWKEPDIALDKAKKGTPLHDALWASIMSGDAGGALTWWWDNYLEPLNLWPVYVGISRFTANIDFANRNFRPITLQTNDLTSLALQDEATGETIFWLHDPASTWKADAQNLQPKDWSSITVQIPTTKTSTVEIWDTRTGQILKATRQQPENGQITVTFPTFQRDVACHIKTGETKASQ